MKKIIEAINKSGILVASKTTGMENSITVEVKGCREHSHGTKGEWVHLWTSGSDLKTLQDIAQNPETWAERMSNPRWWM
jgi:hypothetical protein